MRVKNINNWIESWTSRTIHSFTIISLAKIVLIKHCLISLNNHSISRLFWSVDFYRRKRVIESYIVNWTLNVFLVTHCFVRTTFCFIQIFIAFCSLGPDGKLKLSMKWTPYCEKSSFLLKLKIWQNQRDHNKKKNIMSRFALKRNLKCTHFEWIIRISNKNHRQMKNWQVCTCFLMQRREISYKQTLSMVYLLESERSQGEPLVRNIRHKR